MRLGRAALLALAAVSALPAAAGAVRPALSPAVLRAGTLQELRLDVPGTATTAVELRLDAGIDVDSYEPSPGWTRSRRGRTLTWRATAPSAGGDASGFGLIVAASAGRHRLAVRRTAGGASGPWQPLVLRVPARLGGGRATRDAEYALAVGALALALAAAAVVRRRLRAQ